MGAGARGFERDADGAARATRNRSSAGVGLRVLRTRADLRDAEFHGARIGQCNVLSCADRAHTLSAKAQACWRKADVGAITGEGYGLQAVSRVIGNRDGSGLRPRSRGVELHGDCAA